jgi:hypothetical protein
MSSFKNKSNQESLDLLHKSFNETPVIWCLVIFGSNALYVLIAWMIRRERKSILLSSYEKYMSQSQYQYILKNLDAGIISHSNSYLSYFNPIGKKFLEKSA